MTCNVHIFDKTQLNRLIIDIHVYFETLEHAIKGSCNYMTHS